MQEMDGGESTRIVDFGETGGWFIWNGNDWVYTRGSGWVVA